MGVGGKGLMLARGTYFTGSLATVALRGAVELGAGTGAVQFDGMFYLNGGTLTLGIEGVGTGGFDQLAGQLLFMDSTATDTLVLETTGGFVASGTRLDLSQLYTAGTIGVVAVPEPARVGYAVRRAGAAGSWAARPAT